MLDEVSVVAAIRGLEGVPAIPPAIIRLIRDSPSVEYTDLSPGEAQSYLRWIAPASFVSVYGKGAPPKFGHVSTWAFAGDLAFRWLMDFYCCTVPQVCHDETNCRYRYGLGLCWVEQAGGILEVHHPWNQVQSRGLGVRRLILRSLRVLIMALTVLRSLICAFFEDRLALLFLALFPDGLDSEFVPSL